MEKISGIVPSTARVQSVNLKDSQTMRPGAPSFGAPKGKAAINGGNTLTTAEKAVAAHNKLMARRSGDAHHPEIIRDMADQFFLKNKTEAGGVVQDIDLNFQMDLDQVAPYNPPQRELSVQPTSVESVSWESQTFAPQSESAMVSESGIGESSVEAEYVPPGSLIDVSV